MHTPIRTHALYNVQLLINKEQFKNSNVKDDLITKKATSCKGH